MSTKRNQINNQRNKTVRRKDTQVSYYNKNFKNSPLLPYTNILAYIKTNFNEYFVLKNMEQDLRKLLL